MSLFLKLIFEFFKTGLFSVGGGMATIPFLRDISARTGWYSFSELADMIAVAESTPGPLGVNTATYVGYKTGYSLYGVPGGIAGGISATLGLVFPSVVVIIIVASFLKRFRESKVVDAAFYGLRAASVGLIAAAGVSIVLIAFFGIGSIFEAAGGVTISIKQAILTVLIIAFTRWIPFTKKLHPICFILFSAVVGIVFAF